WLMRLLPHWGWPAPGGLARANSIAVTLEMGVLLLVMRGIWGGLTGGGLAVAVGKMGLATVGMALVLWGTLALLPTDRVWLTGLVTIGLGGLSYLLLAFILRLDELAVIRRRVLRR
ncbi:MAG: hypothetical protein R3264_15120, partial [Anaerolineae bacterium]|nr:hypothetical protein [Anaerolineae bacterium]